MDSNDFSGLSAYPSFHDGYLRSLATRNGAAVIGLEQSTGVTYELVLKGLEALQADDFRVGNLTNIVYGFTIISRQRPKRADLTDLLRRLYPAPTADGPCQNSYNEQLERVIARIENGEATMVILDASLGCNLIAICGALLLVKSEGDSIA